MGWSTNTFTDHDLTTTAHDCPNGLCIIELLITTTMSGSSVTNRNHSCHHCPEASLRDVALLEVEEHGVRFAILTCAVAFPSPDVSARGPRKGLCLSFPRAIGLERRRMPALISRKALSDRRGDPLDCVVCDQRTSGGPGLAGSV